MSTLEIIVEELKALPPAKLEQAAALIRSLHKNARQDRLAALERSARVLTDEEGAALERAIEGGCETIDARDW